MEQIKILFFALASFFAMEDGRIASEKTTITIDTKNKKIEIIQENLFTVILSKNDTALVLKQWKKIAQWKEIKTPWSKELDSFSVKKLNFSSIKKNIRPHLVLNYSNEKDLQAMGIWYNSEKNEFSINHIPQYNIKTKHGKLIGNYWIFNGENTFSFTIEPFLQMPEKYKELKHPLKELLVKN